jgi:hypothetical protein
MVALACDSARAQPQPIGDDPEFVGIRVGFGNKYKVGCWTAVDLFLRGGREPVQGIVTLTTADGDGLNSTVQSDRPCQLLPGQTTRVRLYVKPGRSNADFYARLLALPLEADDELAEQRFESYYDPDKMHPAMALAATTELIVGVGPSLGIESAVTQRNTNQQPEFDTLSVTLNDIGELPTRWYGYDSVDCLVLSGSQPEIYSALSSSNAQLTALLHWIRMGGRVVLSVGSRAEDLIGAGAPFAELVPGKYAGLVAWRPGRALETYVSATDPLPELRRGGGAEGRLEVPRIAEPLGRVDVSEGDDLPLVIRAPYGFGEVVFVAAELDQPPFVRWSQRGRLVSRLLDFPLTSTELSQQQQQQMGFNDLSGQLRAGLDHFTGVKVAPFSLVALLIVCYLVLIGPVDFLLVKKILKRMELTWITFPAIVLLVTLGAYAMAFQMKGRSLLVNQVDVIDIDLARRGPKSFVRGTSWMNVFSPQMRSYSATVVPHMQGERKLESVEVLMAWMGLPGSGFGGMNQRSADPPLFSRSYWFSPRLDVMQRVPIRVWSTKSFTARWSAELAEAGDLVTSDLQGQFGDALKGSVTNHLPIALHDCLLAYRGAAFRIEDLDPGETFEIDEQTQRRLNLELNERRLGAPQTIPVRSTPWQVEDLNLRTIVERMMFFKATGGDESVGLASRYQGFVDLSSHLAMNQAILVGRGEKLVAPMELNGVVVEDPNNSTVVYYRILLPVKPRSGSSS